MNFLRIALVPCSFALVAFYCIAPGYFYGYGDPDFGYLMNSLRISEGMGAWHVDHPGSILQLLGAAVILIVKLLRHETDGLHALITHLDLIFLSTMAASVATLLAAQFILGWAMLRHGYGLVVVMAAQFTPALFAEVPDALLRLNAETTMAACGLLVAAAFLPFLEPNQKKNHWHYILLGCAIGAAMTTKANVWPIALLAFVPLFTEKRSIKASFAIMASIVIVFAVLTIPAWPRYGYLFHWITEIFMHSGLHGNGPRQITSFNDLRLGLNAYTAIETGLLQVIAVVLALLLIVVALSQRLRIYIPVLAAFLLMGFLILKHPAMRYAIAFVPVVALAILLLRRWPNFFKFSLASLMIFLAVDGLKIRALRLHTLHWENLQENRKLTKELNGQSAACGVVLIGSVNIPLPEAGFLYGQNGASLGWAWSDRMQAHFPRYFDIGPGGSGRYSMPMPIVKWSSEVSQFPCQVFVVPDFAMGTLRLIRLNFKGPFEAVGSNNKENRFFLYRHDGQLIAQHEELIGGL